IMRLAEQLTAGRIAAIRLPSLTARALLIYLVFLIVFALNVFGFTDPDFWWHLKDGQLIVDNHTIPTADVFSHTFQGQPRVAQEWASEILLFLPFRAFGYAGDVILFAFIATLSFFFVYRLCLSLGVSNLVSALVVFWAAMLARPAFTVRPLVLTWLFFAIFLASLYLYHRGRLRRLWHLPVLMVLWVNLHGGFIIGLGLIGLLVLARLGDRWVLKRPLPVGHLLAVLGLSVVAALINPGGLGGLVYPVGYAGFANPSAQFISEWQSPDFHESYWMLLIASLVVFMALGVANRRSGTWPILLVGALATMSLQSVRHIPLYGLAMAPVLGETIVSRFNIRATAGQAPSPKVLSHLNWLILLGITAGFLGLAAAMPASQLQALPVLARAIIPYPVAGAEYIRANYPEARIFNDYNWGGYLIYELFPTQRVFVDGRADLYSPEFLSDYNHVVSLRPDWENILERYGIDLVICQKDSPLSLMLTASSWNKVFSGDVEDVFVPR
ncbi:MAG: hypothetical protein Q8R28_16645, partial [Dehalococcoidia bacterium]|nr:hypothetical protein [Dehalococcoidia bacterium]